MNIECIKEKLSYAIGKAERILPTSLNVLRQVFPDAVFVKWAADVRDEPTAHDMGHMQYVDWFFGTFGGSYLKKHLLPSGCQH